MRRINFGICIVIVVFVFIGVANAAGPEVVVSASDKDYREAEELCYKEFISPFYPKGLSADWGGIFSTYLPSHEDDESIEGRNKNHNVSIQSVNLLARYFLLIGDQTKFDEIFKLWAPPSLGGGKNNFISPEFQLTYWLLDSKRNGIPEDDAGENEIYVCSTAEQLEILVNLYLGHQKFSHGNRDSKYERLARYLTEGLKGESKNVPEGTGPFSDDFMLRPLFKWYIDSRKPTESSPPFSNIEGNSLETYYYIINWLKDPDYDNVLKNALKWMESSQTNLGLFRTRLDLEKQNYDSKDINNLRCNSLAGLGLSLDLVKYSKLSGSKRAESFASR